METKIKKNQYFPGLGRRKTAVARVRLFPMDKERVTVVINDKLIEKKDDLYLEPLVLTGLLEKYSIKAVVSGGGTESQREAIRLGVARALLKIDESLKPTLRKAGLLTRDPRAVERKKPGLKKARRAPQWAKR